MLSNLAKTFHFYLDKVEKYFKQDEYNYYYFTFYIISIGQQHNFLSMSIIFRNILNQGFNRKYYKF